MNKTPEHADAEKLRAMNAGDFLAYLGVDGRRWAEAFHALHPDCAVDEDMMLGWFCNALMAGHDAALGNPPLCGDHAEWLLEKEGRP